MSFATSDTWISNAIEVVLDALLHDIGYAGTVNRSRGKSVDGMNDIEKLLFENHIRLGTDYIENHVSSQTVFYYPDKADAGSMRKSGNAFPFILQNPELHLSWIFS